MVYEGKSDRNGWFRGTAISRNLQIFSKDDFPGQNCFRTAVQCMIMQWSTYSTESNLIQGIFRWILHWKKFGWGLVRLPPTQIPRLQGSLLIKSIQLYSHDHISITIPYPHDCFISLSNNYSSPWFFHIFIRENSSHDIYDLKWSYHN